jgi:hypothetical protein
MSCRPKRRGLLAVLGSLLMIASIVGWTASPANATVFSNTDPITIFRVGEATPYPSTIGLSSAERITDVNVTLHGLDYLVLGELDLLLVGPGGQSVVLIADTGLGNASPVDLVFDDAATSFISNSSMTTSGTYKPSNMGAFSAPTPTGPFGSTLSVFNGSPRGGSWLLYAYDDTSSPYVNGSINGGWSLDITTLVIASVTPTSGLMGDVVKITGTGFTGATGVKFGGTSAALFTVDSDTQITATVPAGANTGPVSVTTPNGTATSTTNFVVTTFTITSFTPTSGEVGDVVKIAGTGFTGATDVRFGGVPATTFTVDSDTQITATVPAGAHTGPVSVTTSKGTTSSDADFVVRHPRAVSINLSGSKAKGKISVTDGFSSCGASVPVRVQHREHSKWTTVAGVLTKVDGSYKAVGLHDRGKYRAVAKKTKLGSGDICLKDISPVDRL